MPRRRVAAALSLSLLMLTTARPAWAQSSSLSQLFTKLLVDGVITPSTAGNVAGNPHEAHFLAPLAENVAPFAINKAIVGQLGTFPLGSSSSGFYFKLDPKTGMKNPASVSFGPGFAERAITNGQGQIGFGMNYQHLEFSSFDGFGLHDGSINFVLQHNDCCGTPAGNSPDNPFFEGDLMLMSLTLKVKATQFAPFVSYGLSDRWDVGVVVPLVHVSLAPTLLATIDRVSTFDNPLIHSFDGLGQTTKTFNESGSATGLGDVTVRTKYRFMDGRKGGLAAGLDLRLPTGDKENLLGTGATQAKFSFIASAELNGFAPHANIGYTVSHGGLSSSLTTLVVSVDPTKENAATLAQTNAVNGVPFAGINLNLPNEFNYVFGTDIFTKNITISADIIGRSLSSVEQFANTQTTYSYFTDNGTGLTGTAVTDTTHMYTTQRTSTSVVGTGRVNLLLGVIGAKVQIPGTKLLLTGSVLFPLTNAGLRPNVTPVIGVDYSFSK